MTHIIWTLLIGLVIGVVAKLLTPGRDPGGCLITSAIGIAGAFIATYLGQALNFYAPGQTAGFIGSVIGAIILLAIYHAVRGKRE
jgi:uncharacterized membrane protein YeaQ/YmgE (transglycosylase-associated protein family)